ncbi:Uncharacterised protein [Chryseobacterium indoltheticum]|uniref:Uncharacterized protein n=1 Tax=Chryseobacterium indoltheticum TaxID=254 RepID=A0A381FMZ4_9FLAO|nr:Uncharacterised protein [Chryseobacterium indoltheticum]
MYNNLTVHILRVLLNPNSGLFNNEEFCEKIILMVIAEHLIGTFYNDIFLILTGRSYGA